MNKRLLGVSDCGLATFVFFHFFDILEVRGH